MFAFDACRIVNTHRHAQIDIANKLTEVRPEMRELFIVPIAKSKNNIIPVQLRNLGAWLHCSSSKLQ
jgi:hypothetical protein